MFEGEFRDRAGEAPAGPAELKTMIPAVDEVGDADARFEIVEGAAADDGDNDPIESRQALEGYPDLGVDPRFLRARSDGGKRPIEITADDDTCRVA
jgi:hypothetical protein